MVIGITGHRPHKLGGYNDETNRCQAIKGELKKLFLKLKPACVVSGLALGVDQWAAEVALDLGIKVLGLAPCLGQESKWPQKAQERYQDLIKRIKDAGGDVEIVSREAYSPALMHKRNDRIVHHADTMIAIWDGSWGGTGSCVRIAKQHKRPLYRIHPATLEVIYEAA